MRILLLLLILPHFLLSQVTVTTESFSENRWILNSNITILATKFFIADPTPSTLDDPSEPKGFLELFSSIGVGFSFNYGKASFKRNVDTQELINDETIFSNLIGLQVGVLYSSKLSMDNQNNLNDFSLYTGLNILDLQVGAGYELGTRRPNASRWFISVAYGIPLYKLTGKGSFIFTKKEKSPHHQSDSTTAVEIAGR